MSAPAKPEKRSNFFLGFLLLPARKRQALSAIYAYCRLVDDIVDSGALSPVEARRMLGFKPQHLWQDYLPEGQERVY